MKKIAAVAVFLSAALFPGAAYPATEIDRVVAVVGQNVVTLSELQSEMAPALNEMKDRLRGEDLARETDRLRRRTLNNLIDKYLQIQEAKLQGIEVSDADVDAAIKDIMDKNHMAKAEFTAALESEGYTFDDYKKVLADQLAILRLVNHTVKSKISITEDEVVKYYNENKDKFTTPDSVRVANISFPAKGSDMDTALKNAQAARAEVMAGTPFEEMAAKCTGDPGASKTCVLGTFTKGELSRAIEEKAFAMKQGEVSDPIDTGDGYQLIKIMERAEPGVKPLDEVRQDVVAELSAKQGEALFAKWVQELRSRTYVEIRD